MNEAVMYLLVGVVAVIAAILMVVMISLSKKVSDIEMVIGKNDSNELKDLSKHFYDWTITMSEALDNSRNAITMLESIALQLDEVLDELSADAKSTCSCDLDQVAHIGSLLGDVFENVQETKIVVEDSNKIATNIALKVSSTNEMVAKIGQDQEKISDKIKKLSEKKKKKDKGEVTEND